MKKTFRIVLFICSVLIVSTLNAQNWNPIDTSNWYNYQHDTASFLNHTIRVNSTQFDQQDTTYFFQKFDRPCDTCWLFYETSVVAPFLLDKMTTSGDTFRFSDDTKSYLLYPTYPDSTVWTFDSVSGITAQIIRRDTQTIFGNIDSVVRIELSNSDSVVMSKDHGILVFPDINIDNAYFTLKGIEGLDVGELLPTYRDFFDLNVGDVLVYDYHEYSSGYGGKEGYKYFFVNSKIEANAGFIYSMVEYRTEAMTSFYNPNYVVGGVEQQYTKENYEVIPHLQHNEQGETFIYQDHDGILTVGYGHHQDYTQLAEGLSYSFIGQLSSGSYDPLFDRPVRNTASWHDELVGYVKNGDTVGYVPNQMYFDTFGVEEDSQYRVILFPNPAQESLNIQTDHPMQNIKVSNSLGQIVLSKEIRYATNFLLDIDQLEDGIYTVLVEMRGGKLSVHKLVVR